MKLVIQRVSEARVSVVHTNEVVGKIDKGLFVLVGIGEDDSEKDAEFMAEKIVKMRIMADRNDKINLSVKDVGGKILAVSQFTLYADTTGGNRPSFINAAKPGLAQKVYERFVNKLRELGVRVETGKFGEYMKIDTKLDGPVTIIV